MSIPRLQPSSVTRSNRSSRAYTPADAPGSNRSCSRSACGSRVPTTDADPTYSYVAA
ncbi:MAG: hypothetical protein KJZ54_14290 [Phycisphaerales bacterium]|nr:hypothetical protein [Phycisphaerales bacterium]